MVKKPPAKDSPGKNTGVGCHALLIYINQFSSVGQSCLTLCDPMDSSMPGCPSPTPRACSNSCPLSQWCRPTISSPIILFSSYFQSFPASGSFQMSQFFASSDQSIRVSVSAAVLSMNIQDWFPLGCTGWISLLSKGLSRIFSSMFKNIKEDVQKHQSFGAQLSLLFNSHIHTWLLEKP